MAVTPIDSFSMAGIKEIINKRGRGTLIVSDLRTIFLELQGYDLAEVASGTTVVAEDDAAPWSGRYLNGNATTSDLKEVLSYFLTEGELKELFSDKVDGTGGLVIATDLITKTVPLGNDFGNPT